MSPYQLKSNFWKYADSNLKVVGTNSENAHSYVGVEIQMFNNLGVYVGTFHTNGGRAYYKVPNRNGGNWLEIMDNLDMAARDNNIQHAHNRITETWNKAFDAWNKANDAQVNRIYEIRMVGYVEDGINGKGERNGYVLTKVSRNYGETQDNIKIGSRALQFHRNGQWLNAYFA